MRCCPPGSIHENITKHTCGGKLGIDSLVVVIVCCCCSCSSCCCCCVVLVFCCVFVVCCGCLSFVVVVRVGGVVIGLDHLAPDPPPPDPPPPDPSAGPPNISRFFRLPPPISLFLSLTVCLHVEFGWCLKHRSPPFGVPPFGAPPRFSLGLGPTLHAPP